MSRNFSFFDFFRCCLLFVRCTVFSQTQVYKSDFVLNDYKPGWKPSYFAMAGDNVFFKAPNDSIYSVRNIDGTVNWKKHNGVKAVNGFYLHDETFFHGEYKNETVRVAQFNMNTGQIIKTLPFESINGKPYFFNNIMYATVHFDGGKLIAYNLVENKIVWEISIGFGAEVQPIYLKDKIIANAEDDNWFEIDYNGKFLKTKSKTAVSLDTTRIFVKQYKILTHDGKEITDVFLKKNKLSNTDYKIKTTADNTFIISEKQLLILGGNKKKTAELDLETLISTDNFYSGAYSEILEVNTENIWFYCQNHLVNYDFKNKKLLRKADLTKWDAQLLALENRTIWLISNTDGQLYKLDFEPDQQTANMMEAKANYYKCTQPDPKMIEAAKAAQEKLRNKTN